MADGTRPQSSFHFPHVKATSRLRAGEIVVDLFAGGGGASHALETALARPVDIAINHNPWAISLHAANHPYTRHMCEDVWEADPRIECAGRAVGWLHASPDCTHFSQAKGGQPRSRATRSLSWVVLRWAGAVRPRIISLENVREILKWGPLVAKRDKATGRVVKLDGTVAAASERVPIDQQFLVPDKRHEGRTWRQFVAALRTLGYAVEWRRLKACDYGAGTSRERLFMVARCDGEPIVWPEPTHGPGRAERYVTAADCIDWSIRCPSIFTRSKPLADATLRRVARGIRRYVLDAPQPFIVQCANASANGVAPGDAPLSTVTAWPRGGSHAVAAPVLVQTSYGERPGQAPRSLDLGQPLGTVVAGGVKHAVAAPVLLPVTHHGSDRCNDPAEPLRTITGANRGELAVAAASLIKFRGASDGADAAEPLPTITSGAGAARPAGAAHALGVITAFLEQANGGFYEGAGVDLRQPAPTICAKGSYQRLVSADLAQLGPEHEAGALRVAAFLMRYYGEGGQHGALFEPAATITTKDRLALVTVEISGTPYVIVDIGLRMLQPHELFRAQGFPPDYIIDRTADGRRVSNSRAVAMVGNSVSPPPLHAIARANLDPVDQLRMAA